MMDPLGFNFSFAQFMLSVPRIAAAFLILPLLTAEVVPPMVRNVFFVSVALAAYPLIANSIPVEQVNGVAVGPLVLKEVFVGVVIAYAFSIVFWALQGAGEIIDAKVGTTTAQIADPLLGHQTSLFGTFLTRLASYLFVAFGGLTVFLDLLLTSYSVWPVGEKFPVLSAAGQIFFVQRFGELMTMMLLLAAPALLVLTVVEFGLGFVNRYAQQLNVFSLSLSLKAWLAVFVLLLMLATLLEYVAGWFEGQSGLLNVLDSVLGPAP